MQIKSCDSSAQNHPGLLSSLRVIANGLQHTEWSGPRYLANITFYSSPLTDTSGLLATLLFPRLTNTLPLRTFHLLFPFSGIFLPPSIPMACSFSSLWSLLTRHFLGETWLAPAPFKLQLSEFPWGTVCLLYCTDHPLNIRYFPCFFCVSLLI